jgi:hypothetical protein
MLSRRQLLRSGGLLAAAGIAAPVQAQDGPGEMLPASLAALPSMRDQARPITPSRSVERPFDA